MFDLKPYLDKMSWQLLLCLQFRKKHFKKKCVTEEYTVGNQLIFLKGQNMKNKRKQSYPVIYTNISGICRLISVKFLSMENCSDNFQFFFGDYIGFHDPMNRVANNMLGRDDLGYLVGFLL